MSSSPYLIFGLLLYVVCTSIFIAIFAAGMGYTGGIQSGESLIAYEAPDNETSTIPIIGGAVEGGEMISSVLSALASVLLWTLPAEIFPLWANVIFIKIPLVVLIVAIVEVILP